MATLKEIAIKTGLSVSAVSRALNPVPDKNARVAQKTRTMVLQAAAELGFRPNRVAQGLKKGKVPSIGVFLPEYANRLIADLVIGMSEEANIAGFPLCFHYGLTMESYEIFFANIDSAPQSGLITYPYALLSNESVARKIKDYHRKGGSMVVLNTDQSFAGVPVVDIDDHEGGSLAANRLLERGCGIYINLAPLHRRRRGFQSTVEAAMHACLITDNVKNTIDAIKKYFYNCKDNAPAGCFATTDRNAMILIAELKKEGFSVGRDVLVIGYDDLCLTDLTDPPLTTVHQPFRDEGKIAVRTLLALLAGRKEASTTLKPTLIIRQSA